MDNLGAVATVFGAGGALVYGVVKAIIDALINHRRQAAEVKKQVAEVSETDVNVVAQYITINANLAKQLDKSIQKNNESIAAIGDYRREIKDLKDVLRMVLSAVEQVVPLLQQDAAERAEMRELNRTMMRARDRFNGHTT